MEKYFIPLALVLGLILAAIVTRWMNWYAWGENRYKKKLRHVKRRAQLENDADGKEKQSR
ncbi:MAG TPA: hypothetical protein ENI77_07960 [Nitrospirae bacterium]|nr:hypothetical protein [Nitrospirota bacterium]